MNTPTTPREEQPQIYHLGHFVEDRVHAFNSYLIQYGGVNVIMDVPPFVYYHDWKETVLSKIQIHEITHLFIQTMTMSNTSFFVRLYEDGFVGQIVTTSFLASQLHHVKQDLDVVTIDDAPIKLTLFNNLVVHCYPLDFLPFPKMFMTYVPSIQALFSASLFGSFFEGKKSVTWIEFEPLLTDYHHFYLPGSEFMKAPIKVIDRLKVKRIFPAMGYLVPGILTSESIKWAHEISFSNAHSIYGYDDQGMKNIQYPEVIDRILATLIKQYGNEEVVAVMKSAPFTIDFAGHALLPKSLPGEDAWHQLFQHLSQRKGDSWIEFLRPIVKDYETNGLPLPDVFKARENQLVKALQQAEIEKNELLHQITQLKQQVELAKDIQLRDPITYLYYVDELKKKLATDLMFQLEDIYVRGFMAIQVDQLADINRRYGKTVGDETLRSLQSLIEQVVGNRVALYKQRGPGVVAYVPKSPLTDFSRMAIDIRNAVTNATHFIEKVSVSMALAHHKEVADVPFIDDKIRRIFDYLDLRLTIAKSKGNGEIIDYDAPQTLPTDGVAVLVDEDEINRNMLLRIFKRINYDVKVASSVDEALQIVYKSKVDIIISEINLSKIDGFILKQTLNESKEYSKIPFIMVSHNKTLDNIKRGNLLNVDLILEKPIVPDELIGHVKRYKERRNSSL